jgi:DNA-binding MarR family transcriptional regulator
LYDATVNDDLIGDVMAQLVRAMGLHRPLTTPAGDALSLSDAMTLSELRDRGQLAQSELADVLRLEKSTVSRLMVSLERRGLLARERQPENRRFQLARLTAEGETVADRVIEHMRATHRHILAMLSPAEQDALRVGIGALVRAVHRLHGEDGQG